MTSKADIETITNAMKDPLNSVMGYVVESNEGFARWAVSIHGDGFDIMSGRFEDSEAAINDAKGIFPAPLFRGDKLISDSGAPHQAPVDINALQRQVDGLTEQVAELMVLRDIIRAALGERDND